MSKIVRNVILILSGIVILSAIIICTILNNIKINNPDNIVGNHYGNTNNNGYYCEYNGTVYFANANDGLSLYSMKPDGTKLKKLTKVPVSQINVYGNYVYFYQTNTFAGSDLGSVIRSYGIYRCKTNGDNLTCLKKCVVGHMLLVGDYLYFEYYNEDNAFVFCKININGGDVIELEDFTINPSSAYETSIYYNGTVNDHYLYRFQTKNDISTTLFNTNMWNPVYHNGYIYYMNLDDGSKLCRLNPATSEVTTISHERVDAFAVADNCVFYQTNAKENSALKCNRPDGSNESVIAVGQYCNINVTSTYTYFSVYGNDSLVYRISSNGGTYFEVFNASKSSTTER